MLSTLLKELGNVLQDRKLPFQVGCVLTIFGLFDAVRFLMTDELLYGIRTIGYLVSASAFFIAGEIKNSADRGMRLRYWIVGVGVAISTITGLAARHYS